jgi:hypothetical protein
MKKLILAAVVITAMFTSCKKDKAADVPVYSEENFTDGYLATSGFGQKVTNQVNAGSYEFGNEFIPMVKGKITSLKVKLPDANTALRVTIWDKATSTPIRTETVNVTTANTLYTIDIADLDLAKDKEYTITMNSNDWYDRRKTDGSNTTYPIVVGNIKITSYKYATGATQTYPNSNQLAYYAGDLSFNFQRTE